MQEIGTVISSVEGPNSQEFWFVLNDNKQIDDKDLETFM